MGAERLINNGMCCGSWVEPHISRWPSRGVSIPPRGSSRIGSRGDGAVDKIAKIVKVPQMLMTAG
jgi:hypothetical protein